MGFLSEIRQEIGQLEKRLKELRELYDEQDNNPFAQRKTIEEIDELSEKLKTLKGMLNKKE